LIDVACEACFAGGFVDDPVDEEFAFGGGEEGVYA